MQSEVDYNMVIHGRYVLRMRVVLQ